MTMNRSLSLLAILCLSATLTLSGCNGGSAQTAQSSAHPTASEMSGPPTFNQEYAARNPRLCAKVTSPPTPEQAKVLVQCSSESLTYGMSAMLTLVSDLQVELGQPRPFGMGINTPSDSDTKAMVYPLRGQGTKYICDQAATGPSSSHPPAGQNCQRSQAVPGGIGECYRTSFGDWKCEMTTGGGTWETRVKGPTQY